jgi:hypothetical protein
MTKRPAKRKANAKLKTPASLSPYVVFISHSSKDLWIASVMAEKIEVLGVECWLDEKDIEGGNIIRQDIIRGIDACNEAIVLVSPSSVNSLWVAYEIEGVHAQHKRVTPILNNVNPKDMAPIKDVRGIELNRFNQFLAHLEKRIARYGNK